ncbi:DNA circularization protein [Snodgrassella communis]|uniref:DNA circularization protein n=1 Tax=Snodgrassella communis TaxID=2946699 RepID=UPI000C1ED20A|nr:DNA circularization N-terminal domain-containing protein [Snodgrassella communis]PIT09971.1 hypothetical protein BGI31_02155 [Snodgrassella communis]
MVAWTNNLQPASYKNIGFDVLSINDSNSKALAEHGRPFAAGTDLEDMGTQGRQCQISAVYFGANFDTRLLKLLKALEEPGAGVLIHPIFGVMQNMIATSWSFRTEADNVNYVAIDVTFRETKESQPIFLFENTFLSKIEEIISTLDGYTQQLLEYVDAIMSVKNAVSAIWGSANGLYAAFCGVVGSVRRFFDLDPLPYFTGGIFSAASFGQDAAKLTRSLADMVSDGLNNDAGHGTDSLTTQQMYDVLTNRVDELNRIPEQILTTEDTGDNSDEASNHVRRIAPQQMRPVAQALQLISINILLQITIELIEQDSDEVTASELMHINNDMRKRIQITIDELRTTYCTATAVKSPEAATIYTQVTLTSARLKDGAAQLNALIMAVVNQKPPLRVKPAGIDGSIHQIAHAFYSDMQRAVELMRLNPHLKHPAFIQRNDWINYYVK